VPKTESSAGDEEFEGCSDFFLLMKVEEDTRQALAAPRLPAKPNMRPLF